jgi:putative oxidoreductase
MSHRGFSRRQRIALGSIRGLLAFVFISAGVAKLAGLPFMIEVFDHVGLGQWFRYVTGAIELVSAILLLTHRSVGVGALLLACTMLGAIIAHLSVVPGSPAPAAVLLALSAVLAFAYRDRTLGMVGITSTPQVA